MKIKNNNTILSTLFFFLATIFPSFFANADNQELRSIQHILDIHEIPYNKNLSYNSVTSIVQDKNGFMWFGTMKGLNKYDGKRIRHFYQNDKGLQSNNISSLEVTETGLLIGTESGLAQYDHESEQIYRISEEITGGIHDIIKTTDKNKIIIGAEKGLFIYNDENKSLTQADSLESVRVTCDKLDQIWCIDMQSVRTYNSEGKIKTKDHQQGNGLTFTPTSITSDSKGRVWLGTRDDGLFIHNKRTDKFQKYSVPGYDSNDLKYIRCLTEDKDGNLWIGTENGIFIYNFTSKTCDHYTKSKFGQNGLNDNAIYDIFQSREGIIWIGTFFGGVNNVSTKANIFHAVTDESGNSFLKYAAVSAIFHDSKGRMWYATENEGLFIQDENSLNYKRINKDTRPAIQGNNLHAIAEDPYGSIWIGSFVDGLYRFEPDLSKAPQIIRNEGNNQDRLPDNSIYSLLADNKDTLYIGTNCGVAKYSLKDGRIEYLKPNVLGNKRIDSFLRNDDGSIWMASHFDGIFHYNPSSGKIEQFSKNRPNCKRMHSNLIFCSMKDSNGDLWFGTNNGGIIQYKINDNELYSYGYDDALKHRDVYFIEEDSFGILWMSTDRGIYSFSPETGTFKNYTINHTEISNQFNYNSGYKDDIQGIIYLGSTDGVCWFQPEEIRKFYEKETPNILVSELEINNKTIKPEKKGILKKSINSTENIKLKYDENSITFIIKYIEYEHSAHKDFRLEYRMRNSDQEWIEASNPQRCTYSNLKPGKYIFQVRIVNNERNISQIKEIGITIKPHPLLSPVFIAVYVLIIATLILLALKMYKNRLNDKLALEIEQIENKNLETINRHRINFFTYISHEFKSPLSILMTILNDIGNNGTQREITSEECEIINHNTNRLIFLINQLMEFRSIETNHEPLKYIKGDIVEYCRKIFEQFSPLLKQNELTAEFYSTLPTFITPFDNDKLEKIISNLLSNAIKHSIKRNNMITISFYIDIDMKTKEIRFTVHNTGSYISEEQKEVILKPFFKTESSKDYSYNNGIGLALVKELVDLQKGRIYIESDISTGTAFTICLPVVEEDADYKTIEIEDTDIHNTAAIISNTIYDMNMVNSQKDRIGTDMNDKENSHFTLMIVDDNPEMSYLLKNKLKDSYKIKRASNGIDALESLKANNVDVIISDIIMPKMNGYELCMRMKSDEKLKHIPIILMTSESSKECEMKCLQVGADDFINKPFSIEELQLRINNILNTKMSIKEYYSTNQGIKIESNMNNKDESFIKQLNNLIMENISDSNINVDFLANHMNMSRTQLYVRLKTITGMSAIEYVNQIKIDLAKEKLDLQEYNITEIAWQLGFNSPNYFSKTFKKITGKTPSEYLKNR